MKNSDHRLLRAAIMATMVLAVLAMLAVSRLCVLRADPLKAFATPTPGPTPASTPRVQKEISIVDTIVGTTVPNTTASTIVPVSTQAPERILGANTISVVLMGLDSDDERERAGRGWRSDTIAVLVIDVRTPSCTVLHVPRDTRAQVQKRAESRVKSVQYQKINAAFQYGGGPAENGHENLIDALKRLLFDGLESDVALQYYASIDMDGIAKLADSVGGVPLTLPYDVDSFGKAGEEVTLGGDRARAFVRLRHGITGGSDIGRVERQQLFIKAFAKKVQALGARETIPLIYTALGSEIHTNLNMEQLLVLADLLHRLDLDETEFIILPGACKTIDGRSYYMPATKKIQALALSLWGEKQTQQVFRWRN